MSRRLWANYLRRKSTDGFLTNDIGRCFLDFKIVRPISEIKCQRHAVSDELANVRIDTLRLMNFQPDGAKIENAPALTFRQFNWEDCVRGLSGRLHDNVVARRMARVALQIEVSNRMTIKLYIP